MKEFLTFVKKNILWIAGGILAGVLLGKAVEAQEAWPIAAMNTQIDQTNFIVDSGCSGTLISITEGLVLTNYHCIASEIRTVKEKVVDSDGAVNEVSYERIEDVPVGQKTYDGHRVTSQSSYQTTVVAYDKARDLALLKFRATTIPYTMFSKIYNGAPIVRGETVYAVGNPLGLDATVTKGVVSSVTRRINIGGTEFNYFQIDAGIAPGNSGGSLYNTKGELIGLPAAGVMGTPIGLAIPYTLVQEFLTEFCYEKVFEPTAQDHEECVKQKEEKEKKDK
jgi:S1-C subfamily serine protease